MTEEEKFHDAIRSYLRITGPVYCSLQDLAQTAYVTAQYRKDIAKAADEGKPKPLTPRQIRELRKPTVNGTNWIKAMGRWARNPSRLPVPVWGEV